MKLKQLSLAAAVSALTFTTVTNAILGPIPIYLNTEYRTDSPVIGSIASTLSFNAEDIKATGANTFLEFLETIPSLGLYNPTGNVPAIFIRGNEAKHTLVLVDGVSINDTTSPDGAAGKGLTNVSLNDIEKIEIVKGVASALYGSQAIAGVINIITKKGANGTHGTVGITYGTHNSKTYNTSVSGGNKDGFVRFSHNESTTSGFNAMASDTTPTQDKDGSSSQNTQIKTGNEYFNLVHSKAKNTQNYDRCWNGSTTLDNCSSVSNSSKTLLNVNKKFNDDWKVKLSLAQTKNSLDTLHGLVSKSGDISKNTSVILLNDIKIDNALLTLGVSKIIEKNITKNQTLSSKNLFVNFQKNINTVDINVGGREINHNKFGKKYVYNIGAAKPLGRDIKISGSYGTGFKAPSFYQFNGDDATNPSITPNPNLTPEISRHIELGVEKQYDWGVTSLKLYNNKVKNIVSYIDTNCSDNSTIQYDVNWAPFCGTGTLINPTYSNQEKLKSKGIELSVNANINNYNINFNHDYNDSKLGDSSTQHFRRAKNTTNLSIGKKYGMFNSKAQIIKKSSTIESNNTILKGNTLVNLSTNYKINSKTKLSLNVNNAFDKKYIPATGFAGDFNNAGRVIKIGVTYNF